VRDVERFHIRTGQKSIRVRVRDDVQDMLLNEERPLFNVLQEKYDIELVMEPTTLRSSMLKESPYEVIG